MDSSVSILNGPFYLSWYEIFLIFFFLIFFPSRILIRLFIFLQIFYSIHGTNISWNFDKWSNIPLKIENKIGIRIEIRAFIKYEIGTSERKEKLHVSAKICERSPTNNFVLFWFPIRIMNLKFDLFSLKTKPKQKIQREIFKERINHIEEAGKIYNVILSYGFTDPNKVLTHSQLNLIKNSFCLDSGELIIGILTKIWHDIQLWFNT